MESAPKYGKWYGSTFEACLRRCAIQMSMSIIDWYSAESRSISTALCVLSGSDEIRSFSATVWSCCQWAPGRRDCPVASSRPSDQWQRRPKDWKCWAGKVVWSGDADACRCLLPFTLLLVVVLLLLLILLSQILQRYPNISHWKLI